MRLKSKLRWRAPCHPPRLYSTVNDSLFLPVTAIKRRKGKSRAYHPDDPFSDVRATIALKFQSFAKKVLSILMEYWS